MTRTPPFRQIALLAPLLLLSGCADTPWPTWITGEPPQSVIEDTSKRSPIIPRAKGAEKTWPNLATVPPRPTGYTPLGARQETIKDLSADQKAAADELQKQP
jgi:hypothetical protein